MYLLRWYHCTMINKVVYKTHENIHNSTYLASTCEYTIIIHAIKVVNLF